MPESGSSRISTIGIVQQGRGDQDALLHAFRIGGDRRVTVRMQREQLSRSLARRSVTPRREAAQAAHQLQIFEAREIRVQDRLFGDVAEPALERDRVLADVAAVEQHLAVGGLDQRR